MLRFSLMFAVLLSLTGCQAGVLQTMQSAVWGPEPISGHNLNPAFAYLRVTAGKRVAFLALGNNESHPQGLMEVWYSAEQEVIRLQNGRLAGAGGTRIEWRQVRLPALPSWRTLANRDGAYTWERVRDVMPGYRFNVIDSLQLRVIAPPLRHQLQGIAPSSLTWFEELQVAGSGGDPAAALPPAHYAVEFIGDTERVVYAEQCLGADLCFSWQRWRAGQ